MGDHGLSHTAIRGILTAILETAIVSSLLVLRDHEFWQGAAMTLAVVLPIALIAWNSVSKNEKAAAALATEKLATEQALTQVATLQLADAHRGIETREAGLEILHKAAEAVRRAAIASKTSGGYTQEKFRDDVRQLLETRLREYLHSRLGRKFEFSVTIKWVRNVQGERKLISVFRDSKQGPKRLAHAEENLEGNYFYEKLDAEEHIQSDLLCLVIHDTHLHEIPPALKSRAMDRDYRSCLAVPLNLPIPKPLEGFGLVGFLSVDHPEPWVFSDFFSKIDENRPLECQGGNHRRGAELNLLYGLADSIAAIYLLTEQESAHGT